METLSRAASRIYDADIVAFDAEDNPIMLVLVKARQEEKVYDQEQLLQYLHAAPFVPYAMLVTLREIKIFAWNSPALTPLLTAPTADALSEYDSEFSEKNIYFDYLTTLTEVWLRDVAYHWNSETPPLFDELRDLGLAGELDEGTTRRGEDFEA